jgi:hypothetical protein
MDLSNDIPSIKPLEGEGEDTHRFFGFWKLGYQLRPDRRGEPPYRLIMYECLYCGESPEGLRTCERRQEAAQLYNEEQEGAE